MSWFRRKSPESGPPQAEPVAQTSEVPKVDYGQVFADMKVTAAGLYAEISGFVSNYLPGNPVPESFTSRLEALRNQVDQLSLLERKSERVQIILDSKKDLVLPSLEQMDQIAKDVWEDEQPVSFSSVKDLYSSPLRAKAARVNKRYSYLFLGLDVALRVIVKD